MIQNNEIIAPQKGIHIESCSFCTVSDNEISFSESDYVDEGIIANDSQQVTVDNNTVYVDSRGINAAYGFKQTITSNRIFGKYI